MDFTFFVQLKLALQTGAAAAVAAIETATTAISAECVDQKSLVPHYPR